MNYAGKKVKVLSVAGFDNKELYKDIDKYIDKTGVVNHDWGHAFRLAIDFHDEEISKIDKDNGMLCFPLENIEFLPDDFIYQKSDSYNLEWKLCSEKSPDENEEVILTFKNSAGYHVGEATFRKDAYYYVAETDNGHYEEQYGIPIAWMKKPEPYRRIK